MSVKVLGSPLSPYVRKVVVCLKHKDIAFELDHRVSPFNLPEGFEQLNPLKRIPVIEHNDNVLADSAVICRYLEAMFPQAPLIPDDPYLAAQVAWFEKFADYELGALLTMQAFRQLVLFPVLGREVDVEHVRKTIADKLPPLLDYLNTEIGDNAYVVGNNFTLADLAIVSQFINYHYSDEYLEKGRWRNLDNYLNTHFDSALFASIIAKETGIVAKMRAKAGLKV